MHIGLKETLPCFAKGHRSLNQEIKDLQDVAQLPVNGLLVDDSIARRAQCPGLWAFGFGVPVLSRLKLNGLGMILNSRA